MNIQNKTDYKAAIHELDQFIKDVDEAGGFNNISEEMEDQPGSSFENVKNINI